MFSDTSRSRKHFLVDTAKAGAGLALGTEMLGVRSQVEAAHTTAAPVTITYMDHQKLRLEVAQRWIAKFEAATQAAGKPIQVDLQAGPTPDVDYQSKITVNYAAGNPADVISYGLTYLAPFVAAGYVRDLTPYVSGWADWKTAYYPLTIKESSIGGKPYGVPEDAALELLYYRKDILTTYKISTAQPRSWAELLDRAREIKKKTGKFALLFPAGIQWGSGGFAEAGVNLLLGTHSKIYDTTAKKWVVRSTGLRQTFEFYYTLAKEQLMPVQPLLNPSPWIIPKYKMFPAGQLVVSTGGSWSWEFDWGPQGAGPIPNELHVLGTWDFPTQDGTSKPFVWAGVGDIYTISAASQHPQEASAFIKYMSQPGPQGDFLATIGAVAPRMTTRRNPEYDNVKVLVNAEPLLNSGRFFGTYEGEDQFTAYFAAATEALITLRSTPQQALDQFAAACKKGLGAAQVTEE